MDIERALAKNLQNDISRGRYEFLCRLWWCRVRPDDLAAEKIAGCCHVA
jgi:hypothetical protein